MGTSYIKEKDEAKELSVAIKNSIGNSKEDSLLKIITDLATYETFVLQPIPCNDLHIEYLSKTFIKIQCYETNVLNCLRRIETLESANKLKRCYIEDYIYKKGNLVTFFISSKTLLTEKELSQIFSYM